MTIKFHSIRGWTNQLDQDVSVKTPLRLSQFVHLKNPGGGATLRPDGELTLFKGFQWDGASGPTIDGPSTHRASAAHDAMYRMLKRGLFDGVDRVAICLGVVVLSGEDDFHENIRRVADSMFYELLLEDGMPPWRAKIWWAAVRASPWAAQRKYLWLNRWM